MDAINIVVIRSLDGRRHMAVRVNDGHGVGRGDTAGEAVDDLLRWQPGQPAAEDAPR